MQDAHRISELRSLAAHAEIARRLRNDPSVLDRAKARIEDWLTTGSVHREYALAWQQLLALPLHELAARLTEDSENARALRQCTPFAGVLSPRERWQLWKQVKEQLPQEEASSAVPFDGSSSRNQAGSGL